MHSLAVLVSLLGPEVVVGGQRSKIFKRSAPSFSRARPLALGGDPSPQLVPASVNGVISGKSPGDNDDNSNKQVPNDSGTRILEDWPDWGEPDSSSPTQSQPPESSIPEAKELHGASGPDSWDSNGLSEVAVTSRGAGALEQRAAPSLALDPSPAHTKPPRASRPEKRPQGPTQLGLGEEFTIQVRTTPAEPELDWFADMVPEIKPSALFPEPIDRQAWPPAQLSSKFAAADMPEAEAEGWGEDGELAWAETNW